MTARSRRKRPRAPTFRRSPETTESASMHRIDDCVHAWYRCMFAAARPSSSNALAVLPPGKRTQYTTFFVHRIRAGPGRRQRSIPIYRVLRPRLSVGISALIGCVYTQSFTLCFWGNSPSHPLRDGWPTPVAESDREEFADFGFDQQYTVAFRGSSFRGGLPHELGRREQDLENIARQWTLRPSSQSAAPSREAEITGGILIMATNAEFA